MGLFEGRSRVKRATTAPHGNLSLDVFITNNKLGKRVSKSCMEPPDPDGELSERRLRLPSYPPHSARTLRQRPPPAADRSDSPTPLHIGCNGHGPISEPPTQTADCRRKRLTEAQKLMLNSECHKTEIFATKLRHIPGRPTNGAPPPPPHRNGETPRRRRRSGPPADELAAASPAKKRHTLDGLLLRDNHEYYKVEILSAKLRSSRRLSGDSDGPPHLEPEQALFYQPEDAGPDDSCDSFRLVRRGSTMCRRQRVRYHCGTAHGCRPPPGQRPAAATAAAASSDSEEGEEGPLQPPRARQLEFSFESTPGHEQWYQTYSRQRDGRSLEADPAAAAAAAVDFVAGPVLPYQMSQEELFPPEPPPLPNGAGTSAAAKARHRRLLQLAETARKSPRCHASTRAARCSVDAAEGVAHWDSSLEQVELVAASISSLLTAAQEQHEPCSLTAQLAEQQQGRRRRRRTASCSEPDSERPAHLSGLSLAPPEPPDLAALLRAEPTVARQPAATLAAPPPPPPPPAADDSCSVSTESTASSEPGPRRRGGKRRKNRTGWPRSRARRPGLLQRAVSRAAATVRAGVAGRRRPR